MFESVMAFVVAVNGLAFSEQLVLVGGKSFQSDGPARVKFPGADAHLRA